MTASAVRPAPADPLRHVEATLLGALFLAAVAALSLPLAAGAGPWLLALPACALATARWLRRARACLPATAAPVGVVRRRRAARSMAARPRRGTSRAAGRLLAALALR